MFTLARPIRVLFLCTHNSARSILAEALLNRLGQGRFEAYSAGSSPRPNQTPHPMAIETLVHAGLEAHGLRSKSWDEFAVPDAPHMDLIITVCDSAAGEVCPIWPGHPATAHWGYADPSAAEGGEDDKREAFRQTLHLMRGRIQSLVELPADRLDRLTIGSSARALAEQGKFA
jgi:arsenate reductase